MKTLVVVLGIALIGVIGGTQAPQLAALLQGKSMTYQDLFTQTVDALSEIPALEWSPGSDYKYSAAFTKQAELTLNDFNRLLPGLLERRGIRVSEIETGDRSSQGSAYAVGLADYYVDIEYSQYAVELNLRGKSFYIGGELSADRKTELKRFAYKSLGEASKDIAARLVGSKEAIQGRIDCQPSSQQAYCVTTKRSAQDILNWFIDTYSPSDRSIMLTGYASGAFRFSDKTQITKSTYVSIDFEKLKTGDTYKLWDSDFKRKNFTITYIPASSKGKNMLRVEASWVDGYTPSPEEK
jgi:hypothetical protein